MSSSTTKISPREVAFHGIVLSSAIDFLVTEPALRVVENNRAVMWPDGESALPDRSFCIRIYAVGSIAVLHFGTYPLHFGTGPRIPAMSDLIRSATLTHYPEVAQSVGIDPRAM